MMSQIHHKLSFGTVKMPLLTPMYSIYFQYLCENQLAASQKSEKTQVIFTIW